MSKPSKEKKRAGLPGEYTEGTLHFKTGPGWKACYDSERDLYTAESFWAGYYDLYEINEKIFNKLNPKCKERRDAHELIHTGRHLYKSVSDQGGSYDIALDEDYASLCPWADVQKTEEMWDPELTDLAVDIFESEKQNSEQRRKRREERERKD